MGANIQALSSAAGYLSSNHCALFPQVRRILTIAPYVLILFFMAVNTLGEAWKLGWRVKARCYWTASGRKSRPQYVWCDTTVELDMPTLVWTRGEAFPLKLLASRLKCPNCGQMTVKVWFEVPNQPNAGTIAAE